MPISSIQILDPARGRASLLPTLKLNLTSPDRSGEKVNAEIIKAQKPKPVALFDGHKPKSLLLSNRDLVAESRNITQLQKAHNEQIKNNPTRGAVDTQTTLPEEAQDESDPWLPDLPPVRDDYFDFEGDGGFKPSSPNGGSGGREDSDSLLPTPGVSYDFDTPTGAPTPTRRDTKHIDAISKRLPQ